MNQHDTPNPGGCPHCGAAIIVSTEIEYMYVDGQWRHGRYVLDPELATYCCADDPNHVLTMDQVEAQGIPVVLPDLPQHERPSD